MSSKNADNRTFAFYSSWSLTARLTFLYAFSAFGMLLLATFFLYSGLVWNLEAKNNQFLTEKINILRSILSEHSKPEALEEEVRLHWTNAGQSTQYFARVVDETGHTQIETPGMADKIRTAFLQVPGALTEGKGTKWKSDDGRYYFLRAASTEVDRSGKTRLIIQVGLDVTNDEMLIADYRRKLALVLFAGIVFSGIAGMAVARSGMRPLKDISEAARRITATQLHERFKTEQWPKELVVLASAFNEMLSGLEDSFVRLSRFSADLAHELRTPINNLMGEAEVALSRSRTAEEYRQVIESSIEEYSRLSGMIDSLLFLARAENTEAKISRIQFDAGKEIEAVMEFYDALAEESGVEVTCSGGAILNADPVLFRRAVSNLLSNALQYTPRGGKVSISIVQMDNRSVEISVQDTGSGISPEHLPKVFDRLYRADQSRSQHPQGAGLGLAIVKSIMDLHGGSVEVQSEPSGSTKFFMKFPQ